MEKFPSCCRQIGQLSGLKKRLSVLVDRQSLKEGVTSNNEIRSLDYVDITQCPKLSTNAAAERLPSNVLVNITQDLDDEFGSLENIFSAASMDLGLSDNEEGTEGLRHQE
ncbi:hypothetical protein F441_22745 [Phytophthora nicotianae CJ01A1]|uniref:Uncharacterized protein n=1 Tax=Phytophthora nicotianae CJ01A1 TaxID=1317063 RepID=W2VQA3_PHYNI|nr:hypothetical protein F441_22745 [Phytophthora nicotianae CJ01A1]